MKIKPNKLFNGRHLAVIGIIALLIAAVQILPYNVLYNDKVPGEHKECVEILLRPECTNEKLFVPYTYNEDHTEITKVKGATSCYEYYTNPAYDKRFGIGWALVAFLIVAADVVGLLVLAGWLIVMAVKGVCLLLEDSYEGDDEK